MIASRAWTLLLPFPVLVAAPAVAATHRVPSEHPTINAGLAAAATGDTVLVGPGTYTDYEVRSISGAGTRASCAFLVDGVALVSESGPEVTIIDMPSSASPSPDVMFGYNMLSTTTLVEGFTISGDIIGSGAFVPLNGKLTFRSCVFQDLDAGQVEGGGIHASGSTDLDIIDCEFRNCRARAGGGIYQRNARIEIQNTTFENCSNAFYLQGGTGGPVEEAFVTGCQFINNTSLTHGGGAVVFSTMDGEIRISDCYFVGNLAEGGSGGAASVGGVGLKVIENSIFLFNRTTASNGWGGAIRLAGIGDVIGNTFYGNSQSYAAVGGSTVAVTAEGCSLKNNVIAGSVGTEAVVAWQVALSGSCNVFWDNEGGNAEGYTLSPTDRVIDPMFCDPASQNFTVSEGSPCLPEGSGGCGLIGALGVGCGATSVEPNVWNRSWGSIKSGFRR